MATATLSYNLETLIGDNFDPRRTRVTVAMNVPLIVVDGTTIRPDDLPTQAPASDGTGSFTLVTTNSAVNPTSFAYTFHVDYVLKGNRQRRQWSSSEFTFTTSANIAAISEAFDGLAIAPTWQSEFRDEMEAIAGLTGEDAAIANRINTPGSATDIALNASVNADIAGATQVGGAVWKVGPTRVNVRNYGVSAANSAAANDAALAALFATEASGIMIAFPDLGTYNFSSPLPNRSLMNIEGRGRQTVLNWTTGNMLNVADPTLVQMARFSDVKLTNSGTAGHLIQAIGTAGGLIHTSFERCYIQPGVDGASILKAATYNLFGITFRDCLLHRNATATVPAFDIVGLSGAGTNNIHISGGEWHSHTCASSPFFKADANSASSMINFTFANIIGEQNNGGLIHIGGATDVRVYNVIDMDVLTAYADDLFKFTVGTGGTESNAVDIDHSGSYGSIGLAGGKAHVRITGGVAHRVGWIPKNTSQAGTIIVPSKGVATRSTSSTESVPYELVTTLPTTLTTAHHTVTVSAAGTITLPTGASVGQEFRIKAVGGAGCTVSGNGANIDATATKVLVQYEVLNVLWDGTVWRRF